MPDLFGIGLDDDPFVIKGCGDLDMQSLVADKADEGGKLGLIEVPLLAGPGAVEGNP